MLRKLLFATVICLCLVGISFGQKDNPKNEKPEKDYSSLNTNETPQVTNDNVKAAVERDRQATAEQNEAAQRLEAATRKKTEEEERAKKVNPDSVNADRIYRNAAKAQREYDKAVIAKQSADAKQNEARQERERLEQERRDRRP